MADKPTGKSDPVGTRPDLSVVVPAVNQRNMVLETLEALHRQGGDVQVEVILPERTGDELRAAVRDRFPGVIVIPVKARTSIPAMRREAFSTASGSVVAVIEDHIIVPPDWAAAMVDAVAETGGAVGGWVHNSATRRLSDRAAFLCEYGHMLVPQESGPADGLTGNNVAYERTLLDRFWTVVEEDRWENRLHDALRDAGVPLTLRSDIDVAHKMLYTSALEYAGQRYLYSRAYAGMRVSGEGMGKRLFFGFGALLLPPVLLARIIKNGWSARDSRADLLLSLPLLTMFACAWALGEAVGAFAGPGDALGRVR